MNQQVNKSNDEKVNEKVNEKINKKINELVNALKNYQAQYYEGRASISDEEFDALENELKFLAPQHDYFNKVGTSSKHNNAHQVTVNGLKHHRPMLSLEKTYDPEKIISFLEKGPLLSLFKYDGLACSLWYERSSQSNQFSLTQGKTRGDGEYGEDITVKVKEVSNSIPRSISFDQSDALESTIQATFQATNLATIQAIEIRGEIFCTEENFFKLCQEMENRKLPRPTSLRNCVAGLMLRLDHQDLCQFLTFVPFDVLLIKNVANFTLNHLLKTEEQKFLLLKIFNFVCPTYTLCKTREHIHQEILRAKNFLTEEQQPFLIDGLVFVLNDLYLHDELGVTSHHPRFKLAFKFQGMTRITTLTGIEWNMSKMGLLTPVALVEPVELSGAVVSRVSLHHLGYVEKFALGPGVLIEVVRSGEVIPKFLRVVDSPSHLSKEIQPYSSSIQSKNIVPTHCPFCNSPLTRSELWLTCTNMLCSERQLQLSLHILVSLGVEDLSEKRLKEMFAKKLMTKVSDLFSLKSEDFLVLNNVKEKMAQKFFTELTKGKSPSLENFLLALGIEGLGKQKIRKILNTPPKVQTVANFFNLTKEKLLSIEGFAEKSVTQILEEFPKAKILADELLTSGVIPTAPILAQTALDTLTTSQLPHALHGKRLCITGALSRPRDELVSEFEAMGLIIQTTVNKQTNYLITNEAHMEPPSSKLKKAQDLGIKILSEDEFAALIKE